MPNRLANSSSPYLLQHKDNPVDWWEWSDEPFEEATRRDVPVLLSVGYSACHWCHVMAHESFEDAETAAVMNRLFINIKVDREERPDVDSIYMEAVQAMSGHGGWPMTVFLTPDRRPFYAGTYFPDTDRHGMPSFRRVMEAVSDAWVNRRSELVDQADRLTAAINREIPSGDDLPDPSALGTAYSSIAASFDESHGGFGGAPKFPQQPVLEFLLRSRGESWAAGADRMVERTLTEMADGGIHDHLGGGFARYSVDRSWLVPHFEKMLYDNAQLARIYLWAGIELRSTRLLDVAKTTLDYLLSDLRHPDGGFYSAEDADSEGVEGKFYVWTVDQLTGVLGADDATTAAEFFGVTPEGNFEGSNVLHRPTGRQWTEDIESIRQRLLEERDNRIRPGLDDKIIASWNGLAIRALAEAGAALEERHYLEAATAAAEFCRTHLVTADGLMRSWRAGRPSVPGFLEDHASMAVGLFTLYAATGEVDWYREAMRLTDDLFRFERPDVGYYSTSEGGNLIKRPIDMSDNPLPSGNGLAAEANLLAALYTGNQIYMDRSVSALRAAAVVAERAPSMVGHHLSIMAALSKGPKELAVAGAEWPQMARVHWSAFRPHVALAVSAGPDDTVPLLAHRHVENETRAYLCEGFVCDLPVTTPAELEILLDG